MNKKGMSAIVAAALIILITTTVVAIIWAVIIPMIPGYNVPEFRITVEECRNETIFQDNFCDEARGIRRYGLDNAVKDYEYLGCDTLKRYGLLEREPVCKEIDEEIQRLSKKVLNLYEECIIGTTIEVCEDIEVDKIEDEACHHETLKADTFCYNKTKDIKTKPNQTREYHNCMNNYPCTSYSYYTIMSKEDLSIEWLYENCELINDFGKEGVVDWKGNFWNSKYWCNDYRVEVIR